MKPLQKLKITIDVLMTVGLILSMSYLLIGRRYHEYNGVVILVLIVVHNVLNRKWYKALFRGPYSAPRILQTAVNILMLLAILGSLVSGIILSQEVFAIVSLTGLTAFARTCHLLAAYWGFALISMHVGLHWGLILGMIKKGTGLKKIPSAAVWGLRLLGLMSVLLGARAFLKYNLWGYMSRQIQFVFFDLEQPLFAFFCNYFFMLTMWAWIASYLKKLSENFTRKEDRKSKLKIIFESFLG